MKKNKIVNRVYVILKINIILLLFVCLFLYSCSKEFVKTEKIEKSNKDYRKEGFISKNLYRLVIINSKGKDELKYDSNIQRLAKRRALVSLLNYIKQNNGAVNRNTNAVIINLIDRYGTLKKENTEHESRVVYLFEIKKVNLKQNLDNLAAER